MNWFLRLSGREGVFPHLVSLISEPVSERSPVISAMHMHENKGEISTAMVVKFRNTTTSHLG